jgi:hypothetical protein
MPRYDYRNLTPLPAAAKSYDRFADWLDEQFQNKDINHRSQVVRDVLHEIYLGTPYEDPGVDEDIATLASTRAMPRWSPNTTATLTPPDMPNENLSSGSG